MNIDPGSPDFCRSNKPNESPKNAKNKPNYFTTMAPLPTTNFVDILLHFCAFQAILEFRSLENFFQTFFDFYF